jgi:hypothetical protein
MEYLMLARAVSNAHTSHRLSTHMGVEILLDKGPP